VCPLWLYDRVYGFWSAPDVLWGGLQKEGIRTATHAPFVPGAQTVLWDTRRPQVPPLPTEGRNTVPNVQDSYYPRPIRQYEPKRVIGWRDVIEWMMGANACPEAVAAFAEHCNRGHNPDTFWKHCKRADWLTWFAFELFGTKWNHVEIDLRKCHEGVVFAQYPEAYGGSKAKRAKAMKLTCALIKASVPWNEIVGAMNRQLKQQRLVLDQVRPIGRG
jgi:hypothetical protein